MTDGIALRLECYRMAVDAGFGWKAEEEAKRLYAWVTGRDEKQAGVGFQAAMGDLNRAGGLRFG